jgi:4-hydroxyproline epimerase
VPVRRVRVIDSHTEGEPTRVVVEGGPDLGSGTIDARLRLFRERFDAFRSAVINEPRGSDVLVGAILLPPRDPAHAAAVVFFNNVGFLHACGHGSIGVARTLAHLGRIGPGSHVLETPVGDVTIHLDPAGHVAIDNVPAFRHAKDVAVGVPGVGRVVGDIAWGGNWFFLVKDHGQRVSHDNTPALTRYGAAVVHALADAGVTGAGGQEIDHVELFGPPTRPDCDSKNFVLCPGGAYDRSPCGTGTSAKMACLFADGLLRPGQEWRQESIIASRFVGSLRQDGNRLIPTLRGNAWITAESTLILDDTDPFRDGIPSPAP